MAPPERRCRRCGLTALAIRACPSCDTPYGRLEIGLDRDPDALSEWDPLKSKPPAQKAGQTEAFVPHEVAQGKR